MLFNIVTLGLKKGRDIKKKKSKVEIMTGFIKTNDQIPVFVAAPVDDLQVLKLQISENMSAYFKSKRG